MITDNLWRRIKQILLVLILIGLLIFVSYFVYRLVRPRWVPLAFYTYLGAGIFFEVVGRLWIRNEIAKSRSLKDQIVSSYHEALARPQLLTKARETIASIAGMLAAVVAWPATILAGFDLAFFRKRFNNEPVHIKSYLVSQSLRLLDFHHSAFALIVTLSMYAIAIAGGSGHGYGRAFIMVMGSSVVLRHIRYSVVTEGLPIGLRRLSTNPYLVFLLIAVCDFLTLTLSFAILTADTVSLAFDQQHLLATAISLYRFQELIRILSGQALSFAQILTGIAGLLFYLALLRIAMSFRDFRRDDEDYHWLAARQNMLGNFAAGFRFLRRVKSITKTTEWHAVTSLLGLNEIERAERRAQSFLIQDGVSPTSDLTFSLMAHASFYAPIPDDSVLSLVRHGLEKQVSDIILQDTTVVFASNSKPVLEGLVEIFTPLHSKYPLTSAQLMILTNDNASAITLLDQAKPGSELEEITRLVMKLRATVADPTTTDEEDAEAFLHWIETTFPTIRELLPSLLQPTDKIIAFGQLAVLKKIATILGQERVQEQLTFILDELKEQLSGQTGESVIKALEIRLDSI